MSHATRISIERAHHQTVELCETIGKAIKGKQRTIELAVVALQAEGHLLNEDVPGVGKTTLGHALAMALGSTFHRLQFTSDLLPSDVLGVSVYNPNAHEFEFKPGPIFANIVLADEINRTTPKTQSALLEAMNENQVTIDNVTHDLPRPFMVLATQNPVEHHGTYPLPESQLDRFLMKIEIGYPDPTAEKEILQRSSNGKHTHAPIPVLSPVEVHALQEESRRIHIGEPLIDYMIEIVNKTRNHSEIKLGISPRGTTALFRATQALALVAGRDYVLPDDIKRLIPTVFGHRLVLERSSTRRQQDSKDLLDEIIDLVAVPA
jgi:MoxR-like ATPase